MTETFTLAHLSDVHLAPLLGLRPRHLNVKRGLGYLNWHSGRRKHHLRSVADLIAADALAQRPDHIAVTGDLANLGLPGEFATALAWLKTLGDETFVSVVPGNHDIYSGRMGGETCLRTWAPYMCDGGRDAPEVATFPYVRTLGPLALIGLNSAVPTPPFVASGRLGTTQIRALAEILDRLGRQNLIRVVLIHHPPLPGQSPPRRALEDADALTSVLETHGAELVLHGHNHRQMLSWRTYSGGGIPVLGVASASASLARANHDQPLACYHLLRIARDGGVVVINCEVRGLAAPGGDVTSLSRQTLTAPAS